MQSSKAGTSAAGQGMSSARRKVPLTDEEYNHVARTVKVSPEQLEASPHKGVLPEIIRGNIIKCDIKVCIRHPYHQLE
jgi:hypothetical protein